MESQVLRMLAALVTTYAAVLACTRVEGAIRQCQAPLVVFGASMVDVGENALVNPGASVAEFSPYGVDYFHKPAARFSNGRLLSDFISQGLGYGLLNPYLDSVLPNFEHGVNFASSGSTARLTSNSGTFSLGVQVKQYKLFKANVIRAQSKHNGQLKHMVAPDGFAKAIHFVETAHNDYISTILQNSTFDSLALVVSVVAAMENVIRELHNEGARNIIIMNVIPLGCTPAFLAIASAQSLEFGKDKDSCASSYNHLVDLHNSHLQQLINRLRVELSMKNLVVFDANAIYIDAIRHPTKYGVTHPFMACCGAGGGLYNAAVQCGNNGTVNGKLVAASRCENPAQYISWDGLHPTETFAKYLALGVLSGQHLYPRLSIDSLCSS